MHYSSKGRSHANTSRSIVLAALKHCYEGIADVIKIECLSTNLLNGNIERKIKTWTRSKVEVRLEPRPAPTLAKGPDASVSTLRQKLGPN